MIRVVLFDLGLTLIDQDNHPFDHVPEAITAISRFKTADGRPLRSCLVSDFTMATPPVTPKKVRALFDQYLEVLDRTGLRSFFEPVQRRVTLSTHANAFKPERAVFETALRRLRVPAALEECLLVTENTTHIKTARTALRMQALQFSATGSPPFDFDDWAQAAALIAHRVDPLSNGNIHAAVEAFLSANGVELTTLDGVGAANTLQASGRVWCPVSVPGAGHQQPVHVEVPVHGEVTIGSEGMLHSNVQAPSDGDVAEASAFVDSLAAHNQIADVAGADSPDATHEISIDASGQQRLVRKRFSGR